MRDVSGPEGEGVEDYPDGRSERKRWGAKGGRERRKDKRKGRRKGKAVVGRYAFMSKLAQAT